MSAVYSGPRCEKFAPTSLSMCCPRCESSLSIHQPESELPDRLLATCDECKTWFLANSEATSLVLIPRTAV